MRKLKTARLALRCGLLCVLLFVLLRPSFSAAQANGEEPDSTDPSPSTGVRFSGHVRSVVLHSHSLDQQEQPYLLSANRLRLTLDGQIAPGLSMDVQYDNDIVAGARAGLVPIAFLSRQSGRAFWDLESVYASGHEYLAISRIHRANLTWSSGKVDLRVGRQRIAWGTGRIWSAIDRFNPANLIALDPYERYGIDAVLLEQHRTALSTLSFAWIPVRGGKQSNSLLRWRDNHRGVDYAVTAGQTSDGHLVGIDLTGQLGSAGWRMEASATRTLTDLTQPRWLLGVDYAFANTLVVSAEIFYDGSGQSDITKYDLGGLIAGTRQSLGRHYFGLLASYDISPVVRWSNWLAVNLNDDSRYFSPRVSWSVRSDLDLTLGAQQYLGKHGTEFGLRNSLVFVQAQWFF